jgi:hypothetical protein
MRIAYGYEKQDNDLVQVVTKCMADAALASSPTSFLVNSLPFRMSFKDTLSISIADYKSSRTRS